MNNNYWLFPFAVVGFFIVIGLMILSGKGERARIYDKCLETNSSMVHSELVKMCSEFVK